MVLGRTGYKTYEKKRGLLGNIPQKLKYTS